MIVVSTILQSSGRATQPRSPIFGWALSDRAWNPSPLTSCRSSTRGHLCQHSSNAASSGRRQTGLLRALMLAGSRRALPALPPALSRSLGSLAALPAYLQVPCRHRRRRRRHLPPPLPFAACPTQTAAVHPLPRPGGAAGHCGRPPHHRRLGAGAARAGRELPPPHRSAGAWMRRQRQLLLVCLALVPRCSATGWVGGTRCTSHGMPHTHDACLVRAPSG